MRLAQDSTTAWEMHVRWETLNKSKGWGCRGKGITIVSPKRLKLNPSRVEKLAREV